jgi:CheY-like chemotaxis protein
VPSGVCRWSSACLRKRVWRDHSGPGVRLLFARILVYSHTMKKHAIPSSAKDKLILLVDDEPSILKATEEGLLDRGFTVKAIEGAEAAIKEIHSLKPSLIVSDLVMPGTNGFEFFQEVRKRKEFLSVPFVFLTAVDDYYAKKFGKEIGGAAYITKPVDLDELERIIIDKLGS